MLNLFTITTDLALGKENWCKNPHPQILVKRGQHFFFFFKRRYVFCYFQRLKVANVESFHIGPHPPILVKRAQFVCLFSGGVMCSVVFAYFESFYRFSIEHHPTKIGQKGTTFLLCCWRGVFQSWQNISIGEEKLEPDPQKLVKRGQPT